MKVIDLKDRTIFVDDIIQLYIEENYIPERYNIQTTNGTYIVYKEDYFKVKDYLLSLNDEKEIIKEDKKIEKLDIILDEQFSNDELQAYIEETQEKVNELIDKLNNIGLN